jgi:hypothetical protein
MLTLQEVNSAITAGTFTNDELTKIIDAVRYARAQLTQQKKREFRPGSAVKFYNNRTGRTVNGTVLKVAIKYVTVSENGNTFAKWRVPANMLESA